MDYKKQPNNIKLSWNKYEYSKISHSIKSKKPVGFIGTYLVTIYYV